MNLEDREANNQTQDGEQQISALRNESERIFGPFSLHNYVYEHRRSRSDFLSGNILFEQPIYISDTACNRLSNEVRVDSLYPDVTSAIQGPIHETLTEICQKNDGKITKLLIHDKNKEEKRNVPSIYFPISASINNENEILMDILDELCVNCDSRFKNPLKRITQNSGNNDEIANEEIMDFQMENVKSMDASNKDIQIIGSPLESENADNFHVLETLNKQSDFWVNWEFGVESPFQSTENNRNSVEQPMDFQIQHETSVNAFNENNGLVISPLESEDSNSLHGLATLNDTHSGSCINYDFVPESTLTRNTENNGNSVGLTNEEVMEFQIQHKQSMETINENLEIISPLEIENSNNFSSLSDPYRKYCASYELEFDSPLNRNINNNGYGNEIPNEEIMDFQTEHEALANTTNGKLKISVPLPDIDKSINFHVQEKFNDTRLGHCNTPIATNKKEDIFNEVTAVSRNASLLEFQHHEVNDIANMQSFNEKKEFKVQNKLSSSRNEGNQFAPNNLNGACDVSINNISPDGSGRKKSSNVDLSSDSLGNLENKDNLKCIRYDHPSSDESHDNTIRTQNETKDSFSFLNGTVYGEMNINDLRSNCQWEVDCSRNKRENKKNKLCSDMASESYLVDEDGKDNHVVCDIMEYLLLEQDKLSELCPQNKTGCKKEHLIANLKNEQDNKKLCDLKTDHFTPYSVPEEFIVNDAESQTTYEFIDANVSLDRNSTKLSSENIENERKQESNELNIASSENITIMQQSTSKRLDSVYFTDICSNTTEITMANTTTDISLSNTDISSSANNQNTCHLNQVSINDQKLVTIEDKSSVNSSGNPNTIDKIQSSAQNSIYENLFKEIYKSAISRKTTLSQFHNYDGDLEIFNTLRTEKIDCFQQIGKLHLGESLQLNDLTFEKQSKNAGIENICTNEITEQCRAKLTKLPVVSLAQNANIFGDKGLRNTVGEKSIDEGENGQKKHFEYKHKQRIQKRHAYKKRQSTHKKIYAYKNRRNARKLRSCSEDTKLKLFEKMPTGNNKSTISNRDEQRLYGTIKQRGKNNIAMEIKKSNSGKMHTDRSLSINTDNTSNKDISISYISRKIAEFPLKQLGQKFSNKKSHHSVVAIDLVQSNGTQKIFTVQDDILECAINAIQSLNDGQGSTMVDIVRCVRKHMHPNQSLNVLHEIRSFLKDATKVGLLKTKNGKYILKQDVMIPSSNILSQDRESGARTARSPKFHGVMKPNSEKIKFLLSPQDDTKVSIKISKWINPRKKQYILSKNRENIQPKHTFQVNFKRGSRCLRYPGPYFY